MIERFKKYLLKRKTLNLWKEEKRKKWQSEGMTNKEINKKLKGHKIKLFKRLFNAKRI